MTRSSTGPIYSESFGRKSSRRDLASISIFCPLRKVILFFRTEIVKVSHWLIWDGRWEVIIKCWSKHLVNQYCNVGQLVIAGERRGQRFRRQKGVVRMQRNVSNARAAFGLMIRLAWFYGIRLKHVAIKFPAPFSGSYGQSVLCSSVLLKVWTYRNDTMAI